MTNSDLTPVDTPRLTDLATLANEINDLHDRATEAARTAVEHARACGELLNQAKAQVGHGGFLEWLQANCWVRARQAQKFMRLAREWPAIEAKCASDAHLTIDSVLRLLDGGEKRTQQEPAEVAGGTSRSVQRVVAGQRHENETMAHSSDPFDEDPFRDEWEAEEGHTETDSHKSPQERSPGSRGEGKEEAGGVSRTPTEELSLQRSKTVKTAEALGRAFCDLNELSPKSNYEPTVDAVVKLVSIARNWK